MSSSQQGGSFRGYHGGRGRGQSFRQQPKRYRYNNKNNNNNKNNYRKKKNNNRPNFSGDWSVPIEEIQHPGATTTTSESTLSNANSLTIAIEGCCHGELDAIYERIRHHNKQSSSTVDILLCCGDFQSLRNTSDFASLAVPEKYRQMGSFWKYYAGLAKAPCLTVFVGGNHEASQPLQELYLGGWVAPNIYFMGTSGVVQIKTKTKEPNQQLTLRVGGLSGVYVDHHASWERFEFPPYDHKTVKSIYHTRRVDAYRLLCLRQEQQKDDKNNTLDVMISHDWPRGIEHFGDLPGLLKRKPFFRQEINDKELGSPMHWDILKRLKPQWWFSAHLHVKFMAQVQHQNDLLTRGALTTTNEESKEKEQQEQQEQLTSLVPSQVLHAASTKEEENNDKTEAVTPKADDNDKTVTSTNFVGVDSDCNNVDSLTKQMTQFLSLDKCLPYRKYMSILRLPLPKQENDDNSDKNDNSNNNDDEDIKLELHHDVEWLSLLRKTHDLTSKDVSLSDPTHQVSQQEMDWMHHRLLKYNGNTTRIPHNFIPTVPPHDPDQYSPSRPLPPLGQMGNPITDSLLEMLDLPHVFTKPYTTGNVSKMGQEDENEISLEDDDDDEIMKEQAIVETRDENEIDLEEDDEDDNEAAIKGQAKDENEIDLSDDEDDGTAEAKRPKLQDQ